MMWTSDQITRVDQVASRRLCMGCGACAAVCPEQAISLHNFWNRGIRPVIDESSCEGCDRCVRVCPGLSLDREAQPVVGGGELLQSWGPVSSMYEGHASDPQIRWEASSGGIATALAIDAIENQGFQGVLHTKADDEKPFENLPVTSRSREEILQTVGSRYAPAAPCQAFRRLAEGEGPYVFVGKPCDVAAFAKARKLDAELGKKVGLTVSIFCAGTPTTNGSVAIAKRMGIDDLSQLAAFRYRGRGWPGEAEATLRDRAETRRLTYEQTWGEVLSKHHQLRCLLCPDSTGEFADISCGDSWHHKTGPQEDGISLVLVRTERGEAFWKNAVESRAVTVEPAQPWMLPESQRGLHSRRKQLVGRLTALRALGCAVPNYRGFDLDKDWKTLPIARRLRVILGTMRRALLRKWYLPE